MNILVVDDESIIMESIVLHLKKTFGFDISVRGVCSEEEALDVSMDYAPELVITDIEMPHGSGLDLIDKLRSSGRCRNFLILTAHEEFSYAQQAVRQQVIDYLLKPVDWKELDRHIYSFLETPELDARLQGILDEYFTDYDSVSSPILRSITEYIEKNYYREISLNILAERFRVSENTICKLFREEMNITFLNFLTDLRLRKSVELLLSRKQKNVNDIAYAVGYRSERQFFRSFKQKFNMSPQRLKQMAVLGEQGESE